MKKKQPVLIANRGEIAIRVARTCKILGFPTVAVYTEADRLSEHAQFCDQSCLIDSYLNSQAILRAAKSSGACFIHPGYGFLSERAEFAEDCQKAGLVFVGPKPENIKKTGNKIQARKTIDQLKLPRVPGSDGVVSDAKEATSTAQKIGYPILLKAAAGGGGKGMRRVDSEKELAGCFEGASREALGAFGDGALYVEKFILNPHHIEVQVFGDGKGGAIHLGERECSIQRRHQKVLEETPSPFLNLFPKVRNMMFEAAVQIAQSIQYQGVGTIEFIVDSNGHFYFLEMNTRLQVEHPVTEWVTGVDLVEWQLLLAAEEFSLPETPSRKGSSIEVRIYAEEPYGFLPAPGPIGQIELPTGPFVRVDSAFTRPGEVSRFYDPMITKISVWALTREKALARMRVALDEIKVEPPKTEQGLRVGSLQTNLPFLQKLVRNAKVIAGDTTTDLIENEKILTAVKTAPPSIEAVIALSLFQILGESESHSDDQKSQESSPWARLSRQEGLRT